MSPLVISAVIFVCVYGGAMAGMSLHSRLPVAHQSTETRDVVKLGMGLVATMSALLLGLLISSAKSSYDTQKTELTQVTARLVFLDHVLAHYGPETKETRVSRAQRRSSSIASVSAWVCSSRWLGIGMMALALMALLTAPSFAAGDETPDATLKTSEGSVAIGIGWSWGRGELNYKGKTYHFKI